jgi:hypothetical protein
LRSLWAAAAVPVLSLGPLIGSPGAPPDGALDLISWSKSDPIAVRTGLDLYVVRGDAAQPLQIEGLEQPWDMTRGSKGGLYVVGKSEKGLRLLKSDDGSHWTTVALPDAGVGMTMGAVAVVPDADASSDEGIALWGHDRVWRRIRGRWEELQITGSLWEIRAARRFIAHDQLWVATPAVMGGGAQVHHLPLMTTPRRWHAEGALPGGQVFRCLALSGDRVLACGAGERGSSVFEWVSGRFRSRLKLAGERLVDVAGDWVLTTGGIRPLKGGEAAVRFDFPFELIQSLGVGADGRWYLSLAGAGEVDLGTPQAPGTVRVLRRPR